MWTVYALHDPFTDEVRYVGITGHSLGKRRSEHVSRFKVAINSLSPSADPNRPLNKWLAELNFFSPNISALARFENRTDAEAEERRQIGQRPNLLNVAYNQPSHESVLRRERRWRAKGKLPPLNQYPPKLCSECGRALPRQRA